MTFIPEVFFKDCLGPQTRKAGPCPSRCIHDSTGDIDLHQFRTFESIIQSRILERLCGEVIKDDLTPIIHDDQVFDRHTFLRQTRRIGDAGFSKPTDVDPIKRHHSTAERIQPSAFVTDLGGILTHRERGIARGIIQFFFKDTTHRFDGFEIIEDKLRTIG